MNIENLPRKVTRLVSVVQDDPLNPLVFTSINDVPENPRLGLGYHQLYDPTVPVGLIARLPEVCRVGDVLTLFWDGVQVQQYELDQATIDKGWLSFNVSPTQISGANNQGAAYYTLLDPIAGQTRSSDTRTIGVNRMVPGGLDPDTLTAINETLAPAVVSPPFISSVNTPVTVTVPVWLNMEIGDELTVIWNGIRVTRPPLTSIAAQVVPIPRDVLEQGGSNAKLPVSYEIRDIVDNYSLPSLNVFADVEIDPNALTAPRVSEADPATLVLDLVALGDRDANVLIPRYAGVAAGDRVTLTWVGRTANSQETLTLGPVTVQDPDFDPMPRFSIPNAHLQTIAGGSAMASYEVVQLNGTTLASKRTAITLTGLPVILVAPTIDTITGSDIDLESFKDDPVKVVIAAYRGKQAGDKISLIWTGTQQNGNPVNYTADYIVQAGDETSDYTFNVSRAPNLEPLVDGSLILKYQVVFTGSTSPFDSGVSQYQVKGAVKIIDDFSTHVGALIRKDQSISTQYTTIHFTSGPGQLGFPVNDSVPPGADPAIKLPLLHVAYQQPLVEPGIQTVMIDLNRACRQVECDLYGCNGGITLSLLDQAGKVIEQRKLPAQPNQHFIYSSPSRPIHFLEIVSNEDWTYWDNIVMTL